MRIGKFSAGILQLGEEALLRSGSRACAYRNMLGICVMLFGKPFHQGMLVVSELCRNLHCDMRHQIAALVLVVDVRDAQIPSSVTVSSGWLPAGTGHGLLAIERVDGQIVAEHGPAHRHLDPAVQVVAGRG